MTKRIETEKAAQLAGEYFGNGYHCAESVVQALLEVMGEDGQDIIPYSTAFGGGFGETFMEACGVISGSLIVIGHKYGRKQQGDNWKEAGLLGREVVERFTKLHGTCNCGLLRSRFGEEDQMDLCREVVIQGTKSLTTILNEKFEEENVSNEHCQEKCTSCS
jgi:C_GCAxxG_C_C family probable redox protein